MTKGVITVSFCWIFLLILSMLMGLLESARIYALQVRADQVLYGGLNSLFSMYDRSVFDRYGILCLNEGCLPEEDGLQKTLTECMEFDASPNNGLKLIVSPQYFQLQIEKLSLDRTYRFMDRNGTLFVRNALELMRYYEVANLTNGCIQMLSGYQDAQDAQAMISTGGDVFSESQDWNAYFTTEAAETDEEESSEAEETESATDYNQMVEDSLNGSILKEFQDILSKGLLQLYGVDPEKLSTKKVDPTKAATAQVFFDSKGSPPIFAGLLEEGLFDEYLMSFFSDYTGELDNAPLKYELEYILHGKATDRENLTQVLNRIYQMRLGMNSLAVLGMKSRVQEAQNMAQKIVGWSGIAPLIAGVTWSLIEFMAITESILDMRALLAGKRVPYLKQDRDWKTTLSTMIPLLKSEEMARESMLGVGYRGYLRVQLLTVSASDRIRRAMDIIEWNLRMEEDSFRLADCIFAVEVSADLVAENLFSKAMFLFPQALLREEYFWKRRAARGY